MVSDKMDALPLWKVVQFLMPLMFGQKGFGCLHSRCVALRVGWSTSVIDFATSGDDGVGHHGGEEIVGLSLGNGAADVGAAEGE